MKLIKIPRILRIAPRESTKISRVKSSSLSIFKSFCVCCERTDVNFSKEHVYPVWLMRRTNTLHNPFRWFTDKLLPGKACTLPLCSECNRELGEQLERPVKDIFNRLEDKGIISDVEAELLCRWMWKVTGFFWWASHPNGSWSCLHVTTMRDRLLYPVPPPRDRIAIALARISHIDQSHGDLPMGLDVLPDYSNILSAGVFSRTAIIVHLAEFSNLISNHYTVYCLLSSPSEHLLVHPKIGFQDDNEAVYHTLMVANKCLRFHEAKAKAQYYELTGHL